jgi:hypothetical protein
MAFSLSNGVDTRFLQTPDSFIPRAHFELADLTATSSAQDTTIAGLKWVRLRGRCKTIGTLVAGDVVTVSVIGGTGAAVTSPEGLGQSSYTVSASGETVFDIPDITGWSKNGFQSFKVDIRFSAHSGTFDFFVDAA